MDFAVRNMSEYWQVAVMIQKQMKFYSPLGLTKLGPVEKAGA